MLSAQPTKIYRRALTLAALCFGSSAFGQVAITASGSPSYSQGINVAPGISGMQPNLSLTYAGGGINGPVGHGWSVQGISVITRCPATKRTDGSPKGVLFKPTDKLCLDGQRLIQTDANGSTTGISQENDSAGVTSGTREYRTQKDSFARIRAYDSLGGDPQNGPKYFKVWTKAGQIYEYGESPASDGNTKSAIRAQGKSVAMVWAVTRISDSVGNFMNFKYENREVAWGSGPTATPISGREWNIAEIQYTGNGTQAPTNKVIFRYSDRVGDRAETYQLGSKNVSVRRLSAIDNYINSANATSLGEAQGAVFVRRYAFSYDNGSRTGRSRLVSIKECSNQAETSCLPATRFTYSAGGDESFNTSTAFSASALATTPLINNTGTRGVSVIDFDGDGKADILSWSNTPSENKLYRSNGDGTFTQVSNFNITDQNIFHSNGCYASLIADFNADGLPDIFRYSNNRDKLSTPCPSRQPTYLYLSLGNGQFDRKSLSGHIDGHTLNKIWPQFYGTGPEGGLHTVEQGETFYILDANGDGYLDILRSLHPSWSSSAPTNNCATGVVVCTWLYIGDGQGQFTEQLTSLRYKSVFRGDGFDGMAQQIHVRDVDGDGYSDLVLGTYTGRWGLGVDPTIYTAAWRSKGNGDFEEYSASTEVLDCLYPVDFNGDGRTECLWPQSGTFSGTRLAVSTGMEFATVAQFNLTNYGDILIGPSYGFIPLDVNGDGRTDLFRWCSYSPYDNRVYLSQGDGTFQISNSFNLRNPEHELKKTDNTVDFTVGDFFGNGSIQILRMRHNPGSTETNGNRLYYKAEGQSDLLTEVTSSTGIKTVLTYGTLTKLPIESYAGDRGTSQQASYPVVDITMPAPVVIRMEVDSGVGSTKLKTEYAYGGLKAAVDGRGFLGFRRIAQDNTAPNGQRLTTWTTFLQEEPYAGVASRTETRKGAYSQPLAQLLSQTINEYCDKASGLPPDSASENSPCISVSSPTLIKKPYLRRSIESGWDPNGNSLPVVTTKNTFNDWGDPLLIETAISGTEFGAFRTYQRVVTNTFCDPNSSGCPNTPNGASPNKTSGDNWILGRLSRTVVKNTIPDLRGAITAGLGGNPNAAAITAPPQYPVETSLSHKAAVQLLLLEE